MATNLKEVENTDVVLLEFARFTGPGTRMYRSPKPGEVDDLALPPMRWVQIDPQYARSGTFMRDKKNKVFQVIKADSTPEDIDLTVPGDIDVDLDPAQRELIRIITLTVSKTIKPEFISAISIANLVGPAGIPQSNSSVTVDYLKNRHRPFLMGLEAVELRFQKRKELLTLVKAQLAKIGKLPG
jgi:hypothetical protein